MSNRSASRSAPVLISLPDGLSVSGVTTWALSLARCLSPRGHEVVLGVHREPEEQQVVETRLPEKVGSLDLRGLPTLRAAEGNLAPWIPHYRDEIRRLAARAASPVVFIPTLLGDAFGVGAAISMVEPESLRIIGWQHADIAYDRRVLAHYEPAISRFAGVSSHIAQTLRAEMPARADDVLHLPNAVHVPPAPPERARRAGGPLRLVYTGRLELKQKRCDALLEMSRELDRRGVRHAMTLIGDGPASDALRRAAPPSVSFTGPLPAHEVQAHLRDADCFVLASRYEGLSVSMLEAMAAGCVPVLSRVASGACEAVADGVEGVLVDLPDADAGPALADGIARAVSLGLDGLSMRAWERARAEFSLDRFAERASSLIQRAAAGAPRPWPASRPAAFTGSPGGIGSGTVPPEAPRRLGALLESLAGRRVILHGCGRHTTELAGVLARSPAPIVGLTDDDPARWGTMFLGWRVVPPADAAALDGTDVVISSWLHADAIFARRSVFEAQGLRVHHLYRDREAVEPIPYTFAPCTS